MTSTPPKYTATCTNTGWPVATIVATEQRVCQECAENALYAGSVVHWDDPWDNPEHEVNQLPEGT
jgi:hypothetical protein